MKLRILLLVSPAAAVNARSREVSGTGLEDVNTIVVVSAGEPQLRSPSMLSPPPLAWRN
ncbi:MAG: hypothetical protein J2P48_20000 [Alphaproteobacteria bacterium]|nr:hypothetical protein [Alphaproteobacteria bacterium]